jgi:hypothetical protein
VVARLDRRRTRSSFSCTWRSRRSTGVILPEGCSSTTPFCGFTTEFPSFPSSFVRSSEGWKSCASGGATRSFPPEPHLPSNDAAVLSDPEISGPWDSDAFGFLEETAMTVCATSDTISL